METSGILEATSHEKTQQVGSFDPSSSTCLGLKENSPTVSPFWRQHWTIHHFFLCKWWNVLWINFGPFLKSSLDFCLKKWWNFANRWLTPDTIPNRKNQAGKKVKLEHLCLSKFAEFKWYWTEDGQIQMIQWWQHVDSDFFPGGKHMEFRWRVGLCWRKSRIDSCRLGVFLMTWWW